MAPHVTVVLEGGPRDGEMLGIQALSSGPPETIRCPFIPKPEACDAWPPQVGENTQIGHHEYRRSHFDVLRQRYVYKYAGGEVFCPYN